MDNTQNTKGKLFFPKARVGGFAGDAAYQRADKLAREISGVVVLDEDGILQGIRGVYNVLRDYADVLGKDNVIEDYTPSEPLAAYGFVQVELPNIGKVYARAIGAEKFWREEICNAPFRVDILRQDDAKQAEALYYEAWTYEGNWWNVPEAVREQLIEATRGIKDEFFSKAGLERVQESELEGLGEKR